MAAFRTLGILPPAGGKKKRKPRKPNLFSGGDSEKILGRSGRNRGLRHRSRSTILTGDSL